MRNQGFPPGWDELRVRRVLEHYESQTEEQAVAEDDADGALRCLAEAGTPCHAVVGRFCPRSGPAVIVG